VRRYHTVRSEPAGADDQVPTEQDYRVLPGPSIEPVLWANRPSSALGVLLVGIFPFSFIRKELVCAVQNCFVTQTKRQ